MIRIHHALKSSRAAIDLASIMVGIIVIGLIGGVIAATVFAVIPWAQNNAAKQQLDSVVSAESSYRGLSADKDTNLQNAVSSPTSQSDPNQVVLNSTFTGSAGLAANNLLALNTNGLYCVIATTDGKDYHAYSKSGSGQWYYATSGKTQPTEYTGANVPCVSSTGTPVGQTAGTVNTVSDPATGAVPSSGTGSGAGTGNGSGSGTTNPSTPAPAPVTLKTYTFEDGTTQGWTSPTTKSSVDTLTNLGHSSNKSMRVLTSDSNLAYVPSASVYPASSNYTMVSGQKYRVTAWLYQETTMNPYIQVNSAKSDVVTVNKAWTQVSLDFTATSNNQVIYIYPTSAGTNSSARIFYVDDVVIAQLP
jgi:hypothetical protein